jgi:hypothetical protein
MKSVTKAIFVATALLAAPRVLYGQAEIIRGRVVADSGQAVHAADVYATRAPDRETKLARTDSLGNFSVRFEDGTGDYLINIRAIGYKPLRKRVRRERADSIIDVAFTMQTEAVAVAAVVATAARLRPMREGDRLSTQQGSNEQIAGSGVNGALSPDQAADINAIASNLPGMMVTPNGASALGLPADQNSVLMNGMNFGGSAIPRDAKTTTRVSTSTFDPARGGFSGAQISVDLAPGGIFSNRRGHVTLDAPQLQFSDAYTRALGEEYRGLTASAAADGEIQRDKWFYNASFQSKSRTADYTSLLDANDQLLAESGIAPDSAALVAAALHAMGIPVMESVPGARRNDQYTFLARIDRTPYGDRSFGVSTYLDVNRSTALGIAPTVTPSFGGSTTALTGMLQAIYTFYFNKHYLADTRTSLTYRANDGVPYLQAPAGRISLSAGSLGFGGNGNLATEGSAWLWQSIADLQLYTKANRHKVRVRSELQVDLYEQQDPADVFGTYFYRSIDDLSANRPASFTRSLDTRAVEGGMWSGVLAIGDNLRKSEKLNILFGARVEANRFTRTPEPNSAVQHAFGVTTDDAPNRLHISPRLGFSWRSDPRNSRAGMQVSNLMTRYLLPTGILRGGIGEFRGQMSSRLLSDAIRGTGLPGGVLQLQCVGDAVPLPNWDAYVRDPSLIPEQCANGAPPVYADASRSVTVFAKDYDAPRSWRANLGWSMNVRNVTLAIDGTYSLNVDQPGNVDLNFRNTPGITLSGEGDRPFFGTAANIVPATGAVSPTGSRLEGAFGRVSERRSDLRSHSAQLTLSAVPDLRNHRYYASASYTLASSRAQFRGFDGAAFGDPSAVEWAPGNLDARHQIVVQFGRIFKLFDVTLQHRLTSPLPFSPLVDGDVNGDGIGFDRAFIFAPIAAGPGYARECVESQIGSAAGRNSCRGPWTNALNMRFSPSKKTINTGKRVSLALNASKTWNAAPDPVLYRVRGFDPNAGRFIYETNPRFGDTHSTRSINRNPFRLTLDVSLNIGRSIDIQQLERYLKPGRTQPGTRMSADSMKYRYSRNVIDPYEDIIEETDSLLLSREQVAQLKEAQKTYRAKIDALWADLASYLAELPEKFNSAEALKKQEAAIDEAWEMTRLEGEPIRKILSPLQMNLLGGTVKYVITSKEKLQIRMYRN